MTEQLSVREARPEDAAQMHALICELADYEHALDEVSLNPEELLQDGFGPRPAYRAYLAEQDQEVIGLALLYERYSTWKGRSLYLEDLIVTQSARGRGAGKALLNHSIALAQEGGYMRLEWQVLDWNTPAIDFYRSIGAELDETWINCRIKLGSDDTRPE